MRTILFVNQTAALGGAETSLFELAGALDPAVFRAVVALPGPGPLEEALRGRGVPVVHVPMGRLRKSVNPVRLALALRGLQRCAGALRRVAAAHGAEVIHANSDTAHIYTAWALHGRAPLVWHSRDLVSLGPAGGWMFRRAAAVIAISDCVRRRLTAYADRPDRLVTIRNGIDLTRFRAAGRRAEARAGLGLAPDAVAVGMVAHLVPWKRHDLFLEAGARLAARLPGLRLVIAGDDVFGDGRGYGDALRGLARRLGLSERVVFAGAVHDPAALIEGLDVLVHPAAREPFGRVIVEAMAVGTPVVAVDACGPAEIVRHGIDGMLAAPGSADALAAAVELLCADPGLRARLCQAAARRVAEAFDVRRVAAEVQALYDGLRK
ncbi:MAG: putative glycosyltransferase EpsD [Lentisphaerae bacterium ADurb.BinA184]|nr:MAG: putative glycosyltransferase EpsD [Lentisphaerae bacterium ADurb.BinA184]